MIDNALNIHMCNNAQQSNFWRIRDAEPDDVIYTEKTAYLIEGYGMVDVNIHTGGFIQLVNVTLAPGFMTNLVSLFLLS